MSKIFPNGEMLTLDQEHKAFFEEQKHDREHLFAVRVAWEMLSRKPKINDIVICRGLLGDLGKYPVVGINDDLIDVADGIGTVAFPYTNLKYNEETMEYTVITDEEAMRRGYRRWGYRE